MITTRDYLNLISKGYKKPIWEIRLIDSKMAKDPRKIKTKWFDDIKHLEAYVKDIKDWNVYIGVLPRVEKYKGKDEDIKKGNVFFIDFDSKSCVENLDKIKAKFESRGLPPSMITNTSNGKIHVYFKINQTLPIGEWEVVEGAVLNFAMKELKEFKPDKVVFNSSRILRVPGTLNLNYKNPQETRVIEINKTDYAGIEVYEKLKIRNEAEELLKQNDNLKEKTKEMVQVKFKGIKKVIPDSIDKLIENGSQKGERHPNAYVITKELYHRGFEKQEIESAVLQFNKNCTPSKGEKEVLSHVAHLLENADKYLAKKVSKEWLEKQNYGADKQPEKRVRSLDDIMSIPFTEPEYWIKPFIPKDSMILWGGKPGSFKSMLALAMTVGTTKHERFLNKFDIIGKPKILMYDLEMNDKGVRYRLEYLTKDHKRGDLKDCHILREFNQESIKKEIAICKEYDIIILDSYVGILSGKDENDSKVTRKLFNNFFKKLREMNKTIIVLHHFKKHNPEEINDQTLMDIFRGSSDIPAQFDLIYALMKNRTEKIDENVSKFKIGVYVVKNRDAIPLYNFGFSVLKDDKERKTTLEYTGEKTGLNLNEERENKIIDSLKSGEKARSYIVKLFRGELKPSAVDKLLKELVDYGDITKAKAGFYKLPEKVGDFV